MATENKMKPYGLDGKRAAKPTLAESDIIQLTLKLNYSAFFQGLIPTEIGTRKMWMRF